MNSSPASLITVVVPFLNEAENIPILYERVAKVFQELPEDFRILFVDDGSSDGSSDCVRSLAEKDERVELIELSRNFGHQIAITAGMDHARGDAVVIMDADLQDPPEVIPELIATWKEGYEVVYAVRKSRAGETWHKKFLSATFYRIFRFLVNVDVPLYAGDFRLVDRCVLNALHDVRELHRFVRGLTCWVGFKQKAVYFERAPRLAGETKYPLWKLCNMAIDAMTSFSGAPLRWVTIGGIIVAALGMVQTVRVVLVKLFRPEDLTPGWAMLVALILILGGVQLICIGMVGQYVSRIFEESKKRPLYFLRDSARLGAKEIR